MFMFLCQTWPFSLSPHPSKLGGKRELNIAQSHDPSVPVGESMRLCSCAHYCALICRWEALKDEHCGQFKRLFVRL